MSDSTIEVETYMSGDDAKEILGQILQNQKESLDLHGQLVLLNEKMDALINAVQDKMSKSGVIGALVSNPQSMMYLFVLVLVALFLGLGDQVMDRVFGPDHVSHSELLEALETPTAGPGSPVERP